LFFQKNIPPSCQGGYFLRHFVWLGLGQISSHTKIQNPRLSPSMRKVRASKRENYADNSCHYVCLAAYLQNHPVI
jgi:hypothetical protein